MRGHAVSARTLGLIRARTQSCIGAAVSCPSA
jgi:hypothetical protein